MTREELITKWWPFIQHTILEGVRLYLAGDEPKKFATPQMFFDEVPYEVRRFLADTYNEVMLTVVHKEKMWQDDLYVVGSSAYPSFSRDMGLEEMRQLVELPKGVIPNALKDK